jgi:hypothetical protein
MNKTIWIFTVFLLCAYNTNAQSCGKNSACKAGIGQHEDKHSAQEAGIKLTPNAVVNYGITTRKPSAGPLQKLPRAAFVYAKDKYFIYEKHGDNFREIEILPKNVTDDFITFTDINYKAEKEYVISGGSFLRIIFLNTNAPEAGHGH